MVSHLSEEVPLALRKQRKLGQYHGLAVELCEGLSEEAVVVLGDFENELRRHLIAPGVVNEELGIDRNLGVLLWRLGIGERQLRVEEMQTDVIDTGRSKSVGQYNDADSL